MAISASPNYIPPQLKTLPPLFRTSSYCSSSSFFRAAPKTRICSSPPALKPSGSVDTQLEFVVEPATNTKFPESLLVPGSDQDVLLTLIGTGYREKVFAIIGVKVYAAGLYVHPIILDDLKTVKPEVNRQDRDVGTIFNLVYKAPREKAIKIVLVRDVDGKTFWDALNDAVSPRMISPSKEDQLALSKFRETFQGRALYKGSIILLTWINPSKIIVSVSPDNIPSSVDATIDSGNVASSLYHVYFGSDPVSPSLKLSAESGLARYGLIIS